MNKEGQITFFDHFGLIIIGAGASIVYGVFEKIINSGRSISIAITAAVILTICGLSQFLLNRAKEKLRKANKILETSAGERVETREQHDVLTGMNCQLAQGYLFSKPLSRQKMSEILLNCEKFSRLNPDLQYTPCDFESA